MIILAIETSCDETSAAVIENEKILSTKISSQTVHEKFGGVVPELASRNHLRLIDIMVNETLDEAKYGVDDIDAFADTYGPGLVGALLVGVNYIKGLSVATKKPFIGVNHIEGHIFSNFLEHPELKAPFLALVVSGGHTQLVIVKELFKYKIIGKTRDDAVGEAFDKVAKLLGLGYPGGPVIDILAKEGDGFKIKFPKPSFKNESGFEFSYSGLKTAVLNYTKKNQDTYKNEINDICASFQEAAISVLVSNAVEAARTYSLKSIVVAGGVAANSLLRKKLHEEGKKYKINTYFPAMDFCMDNAAMIAAVAKEKLKLNIVSPLSLKA
ncbi:MAG: tRNA (adenosine(37)-N6)-threonylcarbamoyltransferase complex transferase subunit TsaD, partial [Calditrichia bacterium]|nr:tRNA (adenosine(37)-N6)-threonylcarbamoyltransferase complex transferase subunit TsaD [Calditrichia bacterium]